MTVVTYPSRLRLCVNGTAFSGGGGVSRALALCLFCGAAEVDTRTRHTRTHGHRAGAPVDQRRTHWGGRALPHLQVTLHPRKRVGPSNSDRDLCTDDIIKRGGSRNTAYGVRLSDVSRRHVCRSTSGGLYLSCRQR